MLKAILHRTTTDDQGTEGILSTVGFSCFVLELPWRDNRRGMSCIPLGEYECQVIYSPHFRKKFYWLKSVPDRSGVLLHSGNFAGDRDLGFKTHSEGCLLLGKYFGKLNGQKAVLVSQPTIRNFMEYMNHKPYTLEIKGGV